MTVSVLVPLAGDCPHRARAWQWVTERLEQTDWQVVTGTCEQPWRKATAVADALTRADGDVIVVHDADVWSDGTAETVQAVVDGAPWAMPHHLVHRLDQRATQHVYDGHEPGATTGRTERPYRGFFGGGIVALTRTTYEQIPLDPRFQGWGSEDESWAMALRYLTGPPWRGKADLFHLFHPPAERATRQYGTEAGKQLRARYKQASHDPDAMARLLDEAKEATWTPLG